MNAIKSIILLLLASIVVAKDYRGGEFRTIQSFLYGRYEVRMKSAAGSGVVSSFFTFRDYYEEGLTSSEHWNEIDLEWLGYLNNKVSTNVIIQNEWGDASEVFLTVNPHLDFNTYAIEWTPDAIRFYEGERLIRTVSGERADSVYHAQKIMMNIWQPTNTGWVGSFNPGILPVYALYDWVSYAEYAPGSGSVGSNNNFEPLWEDHFDYWDTSRWQKANHTWNGNNCDFIPANVVLTGGYMVLCLTTPSQTGYNGPALSIDGDQGAIPDEPHLSPAYPNPFNGNTRFTCENLQPGPVQLDVINTQGRIVSSRVIQNSGDAYTQMSWDGNNNQGAAVPSGSYILRVSDSQDQSSQKVLLLK